MSSLLLSLPDDVLVEIVSRVDGDLHAVATTCTRLHQLCLSQPLLVAYIRAAVEASERRPPPSSSPSSLSPQAPYDHHDHPLLTPLRTLPPLLLALKWRATRHFRSEPQRLADFCCALIDALTPVGGARDLRARRGVGPSAAHDSSSPPFPPLGSGGRRRRHAPPTGSRGPPLPKHVARYGCDPCARPYLHAALAHACSMRPLHALVALASALPPVLQPMLLPFLVAGGHAEAALRLLDAEGCLDQPGAFGGRFDLDLGGGAGPGALLSADTPLLPRLRAAARALRLDGGLSPEEAESWWWWWLRPTAAMRESAKNGPIRTLRARLQRLERVGLHCLRWAVWQPVRLGDRPPPGLGPCAGGGPRRAFVAPLAMSLAAAVRLVATSPPPPPKTTPLSPYGPTSDSLADATSRLLWALTEATLFARVFRYHLPGPWYRCAPLLLPSAPSGEPPWAAGGIFGDDDEGASRSLLKFGRSLGVLSRAEIRSDDDGDEDSDDDDDEHGTMHFRMDEDEGAGQPWLLPRHRLCWGQRRRPMSEAERRAAWRWRGVAAFAPPDDERAAAEAPAAAAAPAAAPAAASDGDGDGRVMAEIRAMPPWCRCVAFWDAHSLQASALQTTEERAAAASEAGGAAVAPPPRDLQDVVLRCVAVALARLPLLRPSSRSRSRLYPRTASPDPGGAAFGPSDDPLALPALAELAGVAAGSRGLCRLREAWSRAGGGGGRALFERSCARSGHLAAVLAYGDGEGGGGGAAGGGDGDDDGDDDGHQQRDELFASALAALQQQPSGGILLSPAVLRSYADPEKGIVGDVGAGGPLVPVLCAAGEAGNARAMQAVLLHRGGPGFGALSAALMRACGAASYRMPHPPAQAEAWHPAGCAFSPALTPPSPREWPPETLQMLLRALTGRQYREEAAEALVPALQICLLRRPADRERTLEAVWCAITESDVPVAAEHFASRTGHRLAPTSGYRIPPAGGGPSAGGGGGVGPAGAAAAGGGGGREAGGVEGCGELTSVLALLAARGDVERVSWVLSSSPTAAFKARDVPVLLAAERGLDTLARLILDAPRVSDGFGAGMRQAAARGRAYAAARTGDAAELQQALRDVDVGGQWWSPLLAEMIANAAARVAAEAAEAEEEEDGSGSGGRVAAAMRVLDALVRTAEGKLSPGDAFAALLGLALGKGWGTACAPGGGRWLRRRGQRQEREDDAAAAAAAGTTTTPTTPTTIPPLADYFPFACALLTPGRKRYAPFCQVSMSLAAALLADGSPRALAALARLQDAPHKLRAWQHAPVPARSLALQVGLALAHNCQVRWPRPSFGNFEILDLRCKTLLDAAAFARPAGGWPLPSEWPFPSRSALLDACRPGGPVELAALEAHNATLPGALTGEFGAEFSLEDGGDSGDDCDGNDGGNGRQWWSPQGHHEHQHQQDVGPAAPWHPAEDDPQHEYALRAPAEELESDGPDADVAWDLYSALSSAASALAPSAEVLRLESSDEPRIQEIQAQLGRPPASLRYKLCETAAQHAPYPDVACIWRSRDDYLRNEPPEPCSAMWAVFPSRLGDGPSLALSCAALLSRRGARAVTEAELVWSAFGRHGGPMGAPPGLSIIRREEGARPRLLTAPLWWSARGAELAAELGED